jgi:hypothetical protein
MRALSLLFSLVLGSFVLLNSPPHINAQKTARQKSPPVKATPPPRSAKPEPKLPPAFFPVRVQGKWGYIDRTGKLVIAPQFDAANPFSDGLAAVKSGTRWGYIDTTGKLVIPAGFDTAKKFTFGLAAVREGSTWSYLDRSGNVVAKRGATEAVELADGMAPFEEDVKGPKGYIDSAGKFRGFEQFTMVNSFSDGLALVAAGNKCGYIDKTGKISIELKFDCDLLKFRGIAGTGQLADIVIIQGLTGFSEGLAAAQVAKKWGYIDRTGTFVIQPQFSGSHVFGAKGFSDGLASVVFDNQWGFIDRTGKVIIPAQFDEPAVFSGGLAAVAVNDKWGYIDKTGKFVVPPQFERAEPFTDGLARVYLDNKSHYIDRSGKFVWKPVD